MALAVPAGNDSRSQDNYGVGNVHAPQQMVVAFNKDPARTDIRSLWSIDDLPLKGPICSEG